jgi:hypothetical protein
VSRDEILLKRRIAAKIIADYKEHYPLPYEPASASHLEDCIDSAFAELEAENTGLRKALAEEADTKRLDWLQEKGSITIECNMDDLYAVGHHDCDRGDWYPDLRLAIDAACTQEKP